MSNSKEHEQVGSPIAASLVAAGSVRFSEPKISSQGVFWLESRPSEGGRNLIIHLDHNGKQLEYPPTPYNIRTKVHEYGGGAYCLSNDSLVFCNYSDQQLYRMQLQNQHISQLTQCDQLRFADMCFDGKRGCLFAVAEKHEPQSVENTLVRIFLEDNASVEIIAQGADFYSNPRLSPNGNQIAWLSWSHPNMPWDGNELWIGDLSEDGRIQNSKKIAGGEQESIFQPSWSPDGKLYFISDRGGWWNLFRASTENVKPVYTKSAEFGQAQWVFGLSTYDFIDHNQIVCAFFENGRWHLASLFLSSGKLKQWQLDYSSIQYVQAWNGQVVFCGAASKQAETIIKMDVTSGHSEALRYSQSKHFDSYFISEPEFVEYINPRSQKTFGLLYRPRNNKTYRTSGLPLLTLCHGGPTSMVVDALDWRVQYWTSRGFAVFLSNYSGSTGYGRPYRQRLQGQWGIADVLDCDAAGQFFVDQGLVTAQHTAIRGGSAGGYTALCALTFGDFYKAGASYYGISDLELLAKETHKFESRYLDRLLGPYPEQRQLYRDRSPINSTDKLNVPVLFLHGEEDTVVPINQAQTLYNALEQKGIAVAMLSFPGEQHGFRQAQTIQSALQAELQFYSAIFGLDLAEEMKLLDIRNLK